MIEERKDRFKIGAIGEPQAPETLVVEIDLKALAEDPEGLDLFYGKCRRLEALGANLIKQHVQRSRAASLQRGVIGPDGKPFVVA